jgi:tetratricopeptide (TPR) repeat protein
MVTTPRSSSDSAGKQRRVLTERALLAAKNGQWDEALAANNELLALDPNSAETHNRLGKAFSELGRYREAYDAYARALELEPHNTIAQRNVDRLALLKDLAPEDGGGHPVVRSHVYIEETGKTTVVPLVRPAELVVRARMMPGDPLEVRIDQVTGRVAIHSPEGVYLGEVEPRIAERIVRLSRDGNRYAAAVVEMEADTLRVILREVYQDPSLSDQLSFPTRVRGAAPRAYIRRDFLAEAEEEVEGLLEMEEEEVEVEEVEEEPELEDEEYADDEDVDTTI